MPFQLLHRYGQIKRPRKGQFHYSTYDAVLSPDSCFGMGEHDSRSSRHPTYHAMNQGADAWRAAMDRDHRNCIIYVNRPAICQRFTMDRPHFKAFRTTHEKSMCS